MDNFSTQNTDLSSLRETSDTTRFSARRPWSDDALYFTSNSTRVESWETDMGSHPDGEGVIAFGKDGVLRISLEVFEDERLIVDVRLIRPNPESYTDKLRVVFSKFNQEDISITAEYDTGADMYSLISPFPTNAGMVDLYIDTVDAVTEEPSADGFILVFCDMTKVIA